MPIDFGDIVIKTLMTAAAMKLLRKYLDTTKLLPKWDELIKYAWIATILLLGLANALSFKFIRDKYYLILLLFVIYIIYQLKDVRSTRLLLIATVPVTVFMIVDDFSSYFIPEFYKSYKSYFDSIGNFTMFWIIGFGIYAQRQIQREKVQRIKEEAERKLLEEQRNTLEEQVAERTAEITQQKEELEKTLEQLKATQAQLIQSEKLASLGELTAGIAHEIQNPLNFVNNFSELSVDLAKDLNDEINKTDIDKGYVEELLTDLTSNQEKINHHGKRASSIVKGMLEHSRTSTGVKELTDINELADEYLRLSYHGLRAKDKSFNADFTTDFDENLPKIEVIPQDIGRVLLNLINNAFYAVNQRAQLSESLKLSESYNPSVFVSTQQIDNQIIIKVKDNGVGMSEATKAKIFQPFFTTKPTGQGTGLGLSLAYDIVTKGHGGTLAVESTEGVGTEFIISFSLKN